MSSQNIALRPVTEADDEFLLSVYASTRADELAQVPWTQEQKDAFLRMQFAAQKRHYAAEYPQAHHDIIQVDGAPVGRIYIDRSGDEFHILDVTVLPGHRNRGIGSWLLRRVLDEARQMGTPITIYVESFNPSLRLFERLGFLKAEENGFQLLMRWQPNQ
ncbi:MAG TPA: GNAT family N-acetyltransferase [Candidatus Angelobacter sp.]